MGGRWRQIGRDGPRAKPIFGYAIDFKHFQKFRGFEPRTPVTEAEAASIRRVFEEEGKLSAMIELRRHFPGITDNAKARECARTIAGGSRRLQRPVR